MKVILINGSPHKSGSTYTALHEVEGVLKKEGIETQIFQIDNTPIASCKACWACNNLKKCSINDSVNKFVELATTADGFIFGTPVHYAASYGNLISFMSRVFISASRRDDDVFRLKPAAAVVVARRAGCTSAYDELNKFFGISEMPIISSSYWNMVFGANAEDVKKDEEGMQTMRVLARNMAYFLKCKKLASDAGLELPIKETSIRTNFIK